MIIVSIMTFGLRTSKDFQSLLPDSSTGASTASVGNDTNSTTVATTTSAPVGTSSPVMAQLLQPNPIFDYVDHTMNAWFSLVIFIRLAVTPNRLVSHSLSMHLKSDFDTKLKQMHRT